MGSEETRGSPWRARNFDRIPVTGGIFSASDKRHQDKEVAHGLRTARNRTKSSGSCPVTDKLHDVAGPYRHP